MIGTLFKKQTTTMKISASLLLLLPTWVSAFTTAPSCRPSVGLFMAEDSADAVKAAMAASKEFGATSEEARAAWDIVEEMDAARSHSPKSPTTVAADDTAVVETTSGNKDFVVQTSAEAMVEAKKITEELGIASPEARIAWELVEELAATETHHRTTGSG